MSRAASRAGGARPGGRRRGPEPATAVETWALVLLVVGSIAVLPGALNRFVLPKWAVTSAGVALGLRAPARGRLPRAAVVLLGAGVVALGAAAVAGPDPGGQLIGAAPRYEGLPAVLLYVGALVAGARVLGPGRHPGQDVLLLRLLTGASVAVAAGAALEVLGWAFWTSDASRPGSLLGNASDQGAWGVLVLGPLLVAAARAPSRWPVTGLGAALATVVLSGSRGALLGAAVVVVAVLLISRGAARGRVLGAGALLTAAALAVPAVRSRLAGEGLAGRTATGRTELWAEGWALYLEHPLLGVGPGGFADAVRGVHDAGWYARFGTDFPPDSPHAWPLQALLAGGPVLVVAVLGLLVLTARAAYPALRTDPALAGLAVGLAGYGTALLTHFTGPGHTPLAALFAGALLAVPVAGKGSPPVVTRAASLAAAGVAVVAALGAVAEVPLRQAIVATAAGDLAAAESSFEGAQALRPWDDAVAATAGHAYRVAGVGSGDPLVLEAAERWLTAVPAARRPVGVLYDRAAVREARGDLAGAAAALDEALTRDPANPELLLLCGVVTAQQDDVDLAEEMFEQAARSAPESPAPWDNLARLYRGIGRDDDAAAAEARSAALR